MTRGELNRIICRNLNEIRENIIKYAEEVGWTDVHTCLSIYKDKVSAFNLRNINGERIYLFDVSQTDGGEIVEYGYGDNGFWEGGNDGQTVGDTE